MTIFIRVLDVPVERKADALLEAIRSGKTIVNVAPGDFKTVPGSPFAYWTSERLRALFKENGEFECPPRIVRQGGVTGNDVRYLRLHWEVPTIGSARSGQRWVPFAKGGKLSLWYSTYPVVVRWDDQRTTFYGYTGLLHRASEKPSSADHYFKPGLTWPLRAGRFAPVPLPQGCVFSIRGYAILAPESELLTIAAICNSEVFNYLFKLTRGEVRPDFVVGVLQKLPYPEVSARQRTKLSLLCKHAWLLRRQLDTVRETSHAFILPAGLDRRSGAPSPEEIESEVAAIHRDVDELCLELYEIEPLDRQAIEEFSLKAVRAPDEISSSEDADAYDDSSSNDDDDEQEAFPLEFGQLSWTVGVSFGRFDPRLATGERDIPPEPEPFDPLPSRSPGMYPEGEEPADRPDILVDDQGHPKDLPAHVQRWAEHVEVEVPAGLRSWLAREFFPLHVKMYSKSRRKAPIYWQLATPSTSYSVWLYIHAFTTDTLFRVQNDYVTPKLAHEERQLETLRTEAGPDPVTAQRKAIEAQEAFVEELRAFSDEVKRAAPLWNPNPDDGVIINFAPLWRLVPHHKSWQKDLKSNWDALCAGKYDWAHLAMHLWPERVVPKCAEDRSLAIAHDLEDVFWYQNDDEKWKRREVPTKPIDALVKERTSAAVKAALKSLMEAPEQSGSARRSRGRRGQ